MSLHLQRVLALHFDEEHGSPYWLEQQAKLGFSVVEEIGSIKDFPRLGPFDLNALRTRPYSDFIPRAVLDKEPLIFAETGGATGTPATTAYTQSDFTAAFVQPFLALINQSDIFSAGHWLWLGPGGPHIIGKAAQRIAQLTTGKDAFSIDFDPRWFRRLAPGTLSRSRYLAHVLEQAMRIIAQQDIRFLFCTPVVLRDLLSQMTSSQKRIIRFVYLGGMAINAEDMALFSEHLSSADFLCGYGNTLFGVTHEMKIARPSSELRYYYPTSERLHIRVVIPPLADASAAERLVCDVDYGERGQVVMSRIDESCFLPNVLERDDAIFLAPLGKLSAPGIGDPKPPIHHQLTIDTGIY